MPLIDHCRDCPYDGKAIGSRGNPASRIILVGEAPGATEVVEGRPFRGPAGRALSEALVEAELVEADFFITNAVACRPPRGRPSAKAIDASHLRLVQDLESHLRAVVVALGGPAVSAVTEQRGFRVTMKAHGTVLTSDWGTVVPTLHPAFVRRRGLGGQEYRTLVADLKHARRVAFGPGVCGCPGPGSSSTSGREQLDG